MVRRPCSFSTTRNGNLLVYNQSKELEEMNETKYRVEPNECLYGLINDLWNYWDDGYILPMLKYDIEITRQGDVFIVERGENGNN